MNYPKPIHDLSDPITRKEAPAQERLIWICDQAAKETGRDPRGGGFSFVGQPSVIEHVVDQLTPDQRQLQRPVVIGMNDSDVVAWWITGAVKIPFRCSFRARDATIWVVQDVHIPAHEPVDRRAAAEIRIALHRGTTRLVQ